MKLELRPYQIEAKDSILKSWGEFKKLLLVLPTGCHAKGERLLLSSGQMKEVEKITPSDKLLGADGKERNILYTHIGNGSLYKIIPDKGKSFIISGNHKLSLLKNKNDFKIYDIEVENFLKLSKKKQKKYNLFRSKLLKYPSSSFKSGFKIEEHGIGDYYGFTVDGDNRYLTDDFMVTHNCGKTIVFAKVAEECVKNGGRVLILAHRQELLEQARDKIKTATGLNCALEKASDSCIGKWERIVVGSIQSLTRQKRLDKFKKDYFDYIIVDEAHHCLSKSYLNVLNYFSEAKVLGVTATPDRGDMKSLGDYFEKIAYEYSIVKAINNGYLCKIKAQTIPLALDLKNVKTQAGDFKTRDLGNALDPYLEKIAEEMVTYCMDRKTVVFLPLVSTSQKFRDLLIEKGFNAVEVNGDSKDREKILEKFDKGEYNVLCNSMLLTEGWDCPTVDCVVMLRPTKIRGLYSQCVGRGTRLAPGKDYLLLLDFLWLTERHELCRPASLICKDEDVAKKMTKKLAENNEEFDILDLEDESEKTVAEEREEALAEQLKAMQRRKRKLVDPLQFEMSIDAKDLVDYVPDFGWEMKAPTKKQISTLEKFGLFPEGVESAGKAELLIERIGKRIEEGLSTAKQIRFLENRGFKKVGTWKMEDASNMISRIANANWRTPRGIIPSEYTPVKTEFEYDFE